MSDYSLKRLRSAAHDNRSTAAYWEYYAAQRERVFAVIDDARRHFRSASGTLCILGAGNGNDLDLRRLTAVFRRIHLVDIDEEALRRCVERNLGQSDQVSWQQADLLGTSAVDAIIGMIGKSNVVASTCLLSQMLSYHRDQVKMQGSEDLTMVDILNIRRGHLRSMADLCASGGTVVVVNDLVSSDTVPELRGYPDASTNLDPPRINELMERCLRDRNFFHGCNPHAILAQIQNDPQLADVRVLPGDFSKWVWQMNTATSRLVYALQFYVT